MIKMEIVIMMLVLVAKQKLKQALGALSASQGHKKCNKAHSLKVFNIQILIKI